MLKKLFHHIIEPKTIKEDKYCFDPDLCVKINVQYGDDPNNNLLDIHCKKGIKKTPTIFVIHGGVYISGSKLDTRRYCENLAKNGFCVVNFDYTKCDSKENKYFPEQIYEFYKAYDFLCKSEYAQLMDFSNIFLAGDSAGAHIVSLIANIQSNPNLKFDFNLTGGPRVKGLILLSPSFGIYKFCGLYPKNEYYDLIFGKKEVRNPLYQVSHSLDTLTDKFPPAIMICAKVDPIVGIHQKMFINKAKKMDLSVREYIVCSGYKLGHDCVVNYIDYYPKCLKKIVKFVDDTTNNKIQKGVCTDAVYENIEKVISNEAEKSL